MKGFTLVELLIVIAILGVLSATTIPNIGAFMDGQDNEAQLGYDDCAEYIKVGDCYYKLVELDLVMP